MVTIEIQDKYIEVDLTSDSEEPFWRRKIQVFNKLGEQLDIGFYPIKVLYKRFTDRARTRIITQEKSYLLEIYLTYDGKEKRTNDCEWRFGSCGKVQFPTTKLAVPPSPKGEGIPA